MKLRAMSVVRLSTVTAVTSPSPERAVVSAGVDQTSAQDEEQEPQGCHGWRSSLVRGTVYHLRLPPLEVPAAA
jgi:hypothetical protein